MTLVWVKSEHGIAQKKKPFAGKCEGLDNRSIKEAQSRHLLHDRSINGVEIDLLWQRPTGLEIHDGKVGNCS